MTLAQRAGKRAGKGPISAKRARKRWFDVRRAIRIAQADAVYAIRVAQAEALYAIRIAQADALRRRGAESSAPQSEADRLADGGAVILTGGEEEES